MATDPSADADRATFDNVEAAVRDYDVADLIGLLMTSSGVFLLIAKNEFELGSAQTEYHKSLMQVQIATQLQWLATELHDRRSWRSVVGERSRHDLRRGDGSGSGTRPDSGGGTTKG